MNHMNQSHEKTWPTRKEYLQGKKFDPQGGNLDPREKTFFPGEKSLISKKIILTHEKKKIDLWKKKL